MAGFARARRRSAAALRGEVCGYHSHRHCGSQYYD